MWAAQGAHKKRMPLKADLHAAGHRYIKVYLIHSAFLLNTVPHTDSMKQKTSAAFCVSEQEIHFKALLGVCRTSEILLWLFLIARPVPSAWHLNLCSLYYYTDFSLFLTAYSMLNVFNIATNTGKQTNKLKICAQG